MAEVLTEKRIAAVAKELNVGVAHLVEHLQHKGFKVDNRPTTKITPDMYEALLKEFQQDKTDKIQADKISLGSKLFKSEEKEIIAPKKKIEAENEIFVKNLAPSPPPARVIEKKPPVPEIKEPPLEKEPVKEPVIKEPEVKEAKADILEGPKVVGVIDLEKLETKTRPDKKKPVAQEPVEKAKEPEVIPSESNVPEQTEAEIPVSAESAANVEPAVEITEETDADKKSETPAVEVKKTAYERLDGPKVIGKLDLANIKSKRADYSDIIKAGKDQKRKRKRIYTIDRPETPEQKLEREKNQRPPLQRDDRRPPFQRDIRENRDLKKRPDRDVAPEVSQKEIQEKIRETMARLSGTTKGKSSKAKYRRIKREEAAGEQTMDEGKTVIQVTEFISVAELASLLNVSVTDVIKNCLNLGIIVSINQRLDAEIIELVAHEFGADVEFISVEEQDEFEEEAEEDKPEDLEHRAPIVTIMGHVDHGKTSLLDYIRQSNVVAGEKGGITQHIGAYEVEVGNKKRITFLDTPGHEAFTAMRARGAKLTDIAVIVISADDSVMPQTKEAISHAQAAGVPMIFSFNKMDRPGANADNIRQQLASMNLLVEEWGGKYQSQEISAKQGTGVDSLLEKILLEAELLDVKANARKVSSGTVIEATLDKGRGYVATLLVQEGTLEQGDVIVAGSHFGKIKAMFNERGGKLLSAGPSTPVLVLGLDGAPQAGEKFKEFDEEQEAKQVAYKRQQILREQGIRTKKHITLDEIGRRLALGNFKELNVIVKADFDGSVEALTDSLLKLSTPEIQVNVVHKAVGQITESDVLLASASDAIIIGFQVRPSQSARRIAEKENIEIRLYSIIYDAIDELKSAMEGMLEPKIEEKIVGNAEVREVFKVTKVGTVAGCFMTEGKITRNTRVRLVRDGIVIYSGELTSLKRFKDDVKEVASGQECGIAIKNFNDIKAGDIIEGYEETEVKRTL
ncbi:MAG: translation initiation factor IF-2 [Chitinophagales bacterium]|nr:translation initiation factor IF-2 [Chitinophagales bacterium]